MEHLPEIEVRRLRQSGIVQRFRDGHAVLGRLERRLRVAGEKQAVSSEYERPSETRAIAYGLGPGGGFAQVLQGPTIIEKRHTGLADIESEVDRSLGNFARRGKMPECLDGLLEANRRLDVSGAGGRLGTGLGQVLGGAIPPLGGVVVTSECERVARQIRPVERLERARGRLV